VALAGADGRERVRGRQGARSFPQDLILACGGADTTASTGKYISDNVFLEVQQGVTSGSAKAKLEIELTPSLSAETQIGQQGPDRLQPQLDL
jgi:translocation and assembly module TamB